MKKNKGYTLIETIITLAVFAIAIELIISLVLMMNKISTKQKSLSYAIAEYQTTNDLINRYLTTYSIDGYSISTDGSNLTVSKDELSYNLIFDNSSKKLTSNILIYETNTVEVKDIILKYISNISFEIEDNIVKIEYSFENLNNYISIIKFGVD